MAQRLRAKPKAKAVAKKPPAEPKAKAAAVKAKAAAKAPPARTATPAKASKAKATKAAAKPAAPAARKAPVAPKAKAAPTKAVAKAGPEKAKTRAAPKANPAKALAAKPTKKPAKKTAEAASKTPKQPPYLAAELGQPTDHKGEPVGAGQAAVRSDETLQDYTLQLWRQMQSGRVVHRYMRTMERAGLTADEVWTAGLAGEARATSSTPDEMRRYRQKVLFRANLLEAILSETVADLRRLDGIEPTPPATTGGAAAKPA